MTMRQILNPIGALCVLLAVGLAPPLAALAAKGAAKQAAKQEGPCGEVTAACERAGFARQGASSGTGLLVDCVNPIMQGTSQRKKASQPLPQVDPQVVAACKASNPAFGQGRTPPAEPVAEPDPVAAARCRAERAVARSRGRRQAAQHRLHSHRRSGLEYRPIHAPRP
jgi:hypothetical protein